jgi:peroxiredoxin (alkyl hydroperoxide reductase subunit C)
MSELKDGCVKPAGGPILPTPESTGPNTSPAPYQEKNKMLAKVGKEAIDFEATAFVDGVGFQPVKLSDYKGKWIVVCFYPGDFTFV